MSNDDKMLIFQAASKGYDKGWEACAAIKDAEIAARDLMIKDLREVLLAIADKNSNHPVFVTSIKDSLEEIYEELAQQALAKSEHHNSKALEIKLLEARIDELKQTQDYFVRKDSYAWSQLESMIAEREEKLAELNSKEQ